jgi:hypothetical protein
MENTYKFLTTESKQLNSNVETLIMGSPLDVRTQQRPELTQAQLEKIRTTNEEKAKLPIVSLGKKGDTFFLHEAKHTILDRTTEYLFLQVQDLLKNPDGSIPALPNAKRELSKPYFDVRAVYIQREIETNGFDQPSGLLSQRMEYIKPSYSIELDELDSKGLPTGRPGLNADKEHQYNRYLQAIEKHGSELSRKETFNQEQTENKAKESARLEQLGKVKQLKTDARNELKIMMQGKIIDNILLDSEVQELIYRINFYDALISNI